jgi:hypothetical protein
MVSLPDDASFDKLRTSGLKSGFPAAPLTMPRGLKAEGTI